jgi:hypothetical protein
MGEKNLVVFLDNNAANRYRLFCRTEKNRVVTFRVQYEAQIDGEWHTIVRYDTAHGFPHRDLLHPKLPEEKNIYPYRSNTDVLTDGQRDIKRNWRSYRERYESELKDE